MYINKTFGILPFEILLL